MAGPTRPDGTQALLDMLQQTLLQLEAVQGGPDEEGHAVLDELRAALTVAGDQRAARAAGHRASGVGLWPESYMPLQPLPCSRPPALGFHMLSDFHLSEITCCALSCLFGACFGFLMLTGLSGCCQY